MDFAFAPGGSGYDKDMQTLLALRAATTLVTPKKIRHSNVSAFLSFLENTASITKPVGDLVIASHGDDAGWMKISLDNDKRADSDYEDVDQVDTAGTIEVPSDFFDSSAGASPKTIHIRGCRIGQATPFMDLLKHAFGGKATLTAPKHFHLLRAEPSEGMFEYLGYSFGLPSKTELKAAKGSGLKDKDVVVKAFQDLKPKPKFIDDSDVPDDSWSGWIPTRVGPSHQPVPVYADLGQSIGKVGTKLEVRQEFRHDVEPTTYIADNIDADPGTDADRVKKLKEVLPSDPRYSSSHKYPVYQRLGYASGDDFVDGYAWTFDYDAKKSILTCHGRRHYYTIIVPVTDPATGHLLYNFYPKTGSAQPAVATLVESNDKLFLTV